MRTIVPQVIPFNVYLFNELSDKAKRKVIDDIKENDAEHNWDIDDIENSMDAVCEHFPIFFKWRNKYGHRYHRVFAWEATDNAMAEYANTMRGARALSWINNHMDLRRLMMDYRVGKYWIKCSNIKNWALAKSRYYDAYLTGSWADASYEQAYKEFVAKLRRGEKPSLAEFFDSVADNFTDDYNESLDYFGSDQWAIDEIMAVDAEYLEDGTVYYSQS